MAYMITTTVDAPDEPWETAFRELGGEEVFGTAKRVDADYARRILRIWFRSAYELGQESAVEACHSSPTRSPDE